MIPTKADAIRALVGVHTQVTVNSDGSNAVYHDDQTPPTEAEINTKFAELTGAYDAQAYARNRENEYPNIDELTVALYDTDDKAALETKRAAVKPKWPKDNSGPVE